MRNILFFVVFCWAVGMSSAYAFDLGDQVGPPPVERYPYPPVLSPAIVELPAGFNTILLGNETFYYCNGIFYQKIVRDNKYVIVSAPIGAVVYSLPENYQYMVVNGWAYYVYGGVYYKSVLDGYRVTFPPPGI